MKMVHCSRKVNFLMLESDPMSQISVEKVPPCLLLLLLHYFSVTPVSVDLVFSCISRHCRGIV